MWETSWMKGYMQDCSNTWTLILKVSDRVKFKSLIIQLHFQFFTISKAILVAHAWQDNVNNSQFDHDIHPVINHQAWRLKAFISDALSWISDVVWSSHSAMWRVIEIGDEYVVSMETMDHGPHSKREGISASIVCLDHVSVSSWMKQVWPISRFHVLDQSHANVTFSSISSTQLSLALIVKCTATCDCKLHCFLFVCKSDAKITKTCCLFYCDLRNQI